MKVLLDEDMPRGFTKALSEHIAIHALDAGFRGVKDSAWPRVLGEDWDVFVTADQHLLQQQNLSRWKCAIVVLPTNHSRRVFEYASRLNEVLRRITRADRVVIPR